MNVERTAHALLGNFAEMFVVMETNAPRRYDYSYVVPITVPDSLLHGRGTVHPTRRVAVPEEYADQQQARYFSGLYSCTRIGDAHLSISELWRRLTLSEVWTD